MLDADRNAIFGGWIEAHKAILFKVARAYEATHADRAAPARAARESGRGE